MYDLTIEGVSADIAACVRVILTTPIGTVVFDRDFGVDMTLLDKPMPAAQALFAAEVIDKLRRYEPRAEFKDIVFTPDMNNGKLCVKVVLALAA